MFAKNCFKMFTNNEFVKNLTKNVFEKYMSKTNFEIDIKPATKELLKCFILHQKDSSVNCIIREIKKQ